MKQRTKVELISHMDHSWVFSSLCESIKVIIERFKINHPIFIVDTRDYDLIIGQLFLNVIKFSEKYELDRIFNILMHLYIYQIAIF